jgi:hypothetical protein
VYEDNGLAYLNIEGNGEMVIMDQVIILIPGFTSGMQAQNLLQNTRQFPQ